MQKPLFPRTLLTLLLLSAFQFAPAAEGPGPFSKLRIVPQTGHEAHDAAQRAEADAKRNADPKLKKFAAKLAEDRAAARRTVILGDRDVYWNDDGQGQFIVILNEYDL